MDFFTVIKSRKSIREFEPKPISKDIIEKIVDCGRLSATARNEQPWEFIVTTDKKTLTDLSKLAPNGVFMKDASFIIVTFSKDTKYYLEDCSSATENMLLSIEALGLGGCWIAGDKKDYAEKFKDYFNVPNGYKLVSIIAAGYPKKKEFSKQKRNLQDVLHWNKW